MAAPIISISSDSSEESVGSHALQVILFGVIPAIILVILEVLVVPADPIVTPKVGTVLVVLPSGVLDLVDYSPSSDSDPSEDSLPPAPDLPLVSPFCVLMTRRRTETKWKGTSTREGNGYKLWYSGSSSGRNGVGVILTARLKDNVVKVSRCGDRIMALSVVIEGETVNLISAYTPQVGLSDAIKKKFWDELDEIVRECLTVQHLFIGGDLNGHIGSAADRYAGVHGGFGFGARNEEGRAILEFATAHDLVVANSFFKKRDAHLITFQSGSHNTQIDYLLVRRGDLRTCKDCRAFPSEACSSQHRLVTLDVLFERQRHRREATGRARILWKNLKGDVAETFKATVLEKLSALEEDMSTSSAEQMWNTLAHTIKDVARDSLGVVSESARTHSTHRESWWFSEEVQTKVAAKQSRFKELLSCRESNLEDIDSAKERYKLAKREAKIAVARAKDKAYEDLYKKLDSKEGANDIYKIAKARERRRRDLGNVRYIKDEGGRTIVREEDIRKRWGEYFYSLFNESSPEGREVGSASPHLPQDCYYSRINQQEVRIALQKMGRNNVIGPDTRGHPLVRGCPPRGGDSYQSQILQPKESFRYLGSVIHRSGRVDDDVAHRIRAGWVKWKADLGV
ncbi:aminopeptidase M1 [Tanacetum coccineum]